MGWPDTGDRSLEAEEPTVNSKKLVMYRKQQTRDRKAKARFLTGEERSYIYRKAGKPWSGLETNVN